MATSRGRKPLVAVVGGAGAMGRAVVFDLARQGHRVLVVDRDLQAARRAARTYGGGRATADALDARDTPALAARLGAARAAALVNAGPFPFNLPVMAAALEARCHYLDLGGLFHTTRVQLTHDADFRRHGLLALLGWGAPPASRTCWPEPPRIRFPMCARCECTTAGPTSRATRRRWLSASPPPPCSTSSPSRRWSSAAAAFVPRLRSAGPRTCSSTWGFNART